MAVIISDSTVVNTVEVSLASGLLVSIENAIDIVEVGRWFHSLFLHQSVRQAWKMLAIFQIFIEGSFLLWYVLDNFFEIVYIFYG